MNYKVQRLFRKEVHCKQMTMEVHCTQMGDDIVYTRIRKVEVF